MAEKKKKILFICSNMGIGGFQKSLINLLSYFDYGAYDVTLFLIHKEGIFLKYLDSHVRILSDETADDYCDSYKPAMKKLLEHRRYLLAWRRTVNLALSLIDKGYGAVYMSRQIPALGESFDVAVDYGGQFQNYYMIDRVKADKKITFFHNDYSKWDYYKKADRKYYRKNDWIATVSEECVESMIRYFPECRDKIIRIENIVTQRTIQQMAQIQEDHDISVLPERKWMLCTVGRVCGDKGTDLAIEACSYVRRALGNNFLWVWVGPGGEQSIYQDMLDRYGVRDSFYFVGSKLNPYVYMKKADLIVHPARFEGKAVAVEEALVLHKPVVATAYSTVKNQIWNGETGIIVEMSAEAIGEEILRLLRSPEQMWEMQENQKRLCRGNAEEIEKLYKILD